MNAASAQSHYLSLASSMNADFTHALLSRGFRHVNEPFILPGLAHLVAPDLAPAPTLAASQGPLPALTNRPCRPLPPEAVVDLSPSSDDVPVEESSPAQTEVPPHVCKAPSAIRTDPPAPSEPQREAQAALVSSPPLTTPPLSMVPPTSPPPRAPPKAPTVPPTRQEPERSPQSPRTAFGPQNSQFPRTRNDPATVPSPYSAFPRGDTRGKGKSQRSIGTGTQRISAIPYPEAARNSPGSDGLHSRHRPQRGRPRSRSPRRSPRILRRHRHSPHATRRPSRTSRARRTSSPFRRASELQPNANPYSEIRPPRSVSLASTQSCPENRPQRSRPIRSGRPTHDTEVAPVFRPQSIDGMDPLETQERPSPLPWEHPARSVTAGTLALWSPRQHHHPYRFPAFEQANPSGLAIPGTALPDNTQAQSPPPLLTGSNEDLVILGNAPEEEIIESLTRLSDTVRWAGNIRLPVISGPSVHPYIQQRRALHLSDVHLHTHSQILADISALIPPTSSPDGLSITIPSASGPFVLRWPQLRLAPLVHGTTNTSTAPLHPGLLGRTLSRLQSTEVSPSPDDTVPSDDDRQQTSTAGVPPPTEPLVILSDAPDSEIISALRRVSETINNEDTLGLAEVSNPSANSHSIIRRVIHFLGPRTPPHTQIFEELTRSLPISRSPGFQTVTIPSESGPFVVLWPQAGASGNAPSGPPLGLPLTRNLRPWRPPPIPIGPTNSGVFVPFLRATADLLTVLEDREWRSDHRTSNRWGDLVSAARGRRIPLLQLICDLQQRIGIRPQSDHTAPSVALNLLQSPVLHSDLGLSVPITQLDCVSLPQLVPLLQLSDGYIDAVIQESLIASFMPRSELDLLMHITDSFRVDPLQVPAIPPSPQRSKGRGKRSKGKSPSPKATPKSSRTPANRGRGRGAGGRGSRTSATHPTSIPSSCNAPKSRPLPQPLQFSGHLPVDPSSLLSCAPPPTLPVPTASQSQSLALQHLASPPPISAPPDAAGPPCSTVAICSPMRSVNSGDIRAMLLPTGASRRTASPPSCLPHAPDGRSPVTSAVPTPTNRGHRPTHAQVLQLLFTGAQDNPVERRQITWLSQHSMFQLWQSTSEESCVICQHPIAQLEAVATTSCIHHFHALCLSHGQSRALSGYGLCPTCRTPLSSLENLAHIP